MKRGLYLAIVLSVVVLLLSVSLVSASWFSDFWNNLIGKPKLSPSLSPAFNLNDHPNAVLNVDIQQNEQAGCSQYYTGVDSQGIVREYPNTMPVPSDKHYELPFAGNKCFGNINEVMACINPLGNDEVTVTIAPSVFFPSDLKSKFSHTTGTLSVGESLYSEIDGRVGSYSFRVPVSDLMSKVEAGGSFEDSENPYLFDSSNSFLGYYLHYKFFNSKMEEVGYCSQPSIDNNWGNAPECHYIASCSISPSFSFQYVSSPSPTPEPTTSCTPDCEGKECGSDGCEGTCGECEDGEICTDGQCEIPIPVSINCGNGKIDKEEGEECDGNLSDGNTCADFKNGEGKSFTGGNLLCASNCEFDTSKCTIEENSVSFGLDMDDSSSHNDYKNNGFYIPNLGGPVTPFDDVSCDLITNINDKTKTFQGKIVRVQEDGSGGAVLLEGILTFNKDYNNRIREYSWKISGWPNGWFHGSIIEDELTSVFLNKKVRCVVQVENKNISSNIKEIGSCVHAYGADNAKFTIVHMRGQSAGLIAAQLVKKAEDNRIEGYGKISPFAENQDRFAYYIDLNVHDDSSWKTVQDIDGKYFSNEVYENVRKLAEKDCKIYPSIPTFYNTRTYKGYTDLGVGGKAIFLNPSEPAMAAVHETGHALGHLYDEYKYPFLGDFNTDGEENCVKNANVFGKFGDRIYGIGCSQYSRFFRPSVNSIMKNSHRGSSFNVISCGYCLSVIKRGNVNAKTEDFQACMNMPDTIKPGTQCVIPDDCTSIMDTTCISGCNSGKCEAKKDGTECWVHLGYGKCNSGGKCIIQPEWECLPGDINECDNWHGWDSMCGVCDINHACKVNVGAKCTIGTIKGVVGTAAPPSTAPTPGVKVVSVTPPDGICNPQGKCTQDGK